ncbi:hypothetical protein D3C76_1770340 [compost metagenome]
MLGLQLIHKHPRLLSFTHGGGFVEGRVEPLVQFVMKGQDAAGKAGQGQKQRGDQAEVAVEQYVKLTHE